MDRVKKRISDCDEQTGALMLILNR
uniref:Uncharacterized protein n=1 Tax=Tetranychus urticae TaxID=32264 RepID=T1JSM4_TETUR